MNFRAALIIRTILLSLLLVGLVQILPAGQRQCEDSLPLLVKIGDFNREHRLSQAPTGALKYIGSEGRTGAWYVDEAGVRWFANPDVPHDELQTSAEVIGSLVYRRFGY